MALKDLAPPVRPKATLVYAPHPMLAEAGRVIRETYTIHGETLGGYLRRHGVDTATPLVVTVDGKPVARDEWELLDPLPGQLVAARGAVAGGDGGGSQVVAMVAMIALAVFAPYLSGVLVSQVGGVGAAAALGSTGLGIVTAATTGVITLAGSMLINKLFPPPKMDLGKGLGALQASASYSITGGQNRARPFEPLALVLGTHRVFFDLAGRPYSTYQGEDQYLYQVFCVGLVGPHGPLDVSDLRIGTTLLSTYEGVTTETSIGTMPTMMPANVDTIAGASITAADPQAVRTTSPGTTKIELDFTCMAYRARSDGDIEGALLDWTIEYCAAGTGAWQTLEYVTTYGNGQKPIRLSRSYAVDSGTYDVRVTGHTLSTSSKFIRQLTWDAVKCYQPDDGYYEGQQFLAVKIKATGQLNGVIDRLNGIVRMPTAPGVYSSNPADLLTLFAIGHKAADGRPLWGGQLSSSALDVAGLDAWRTWCTAKGLTFNAVVDSQRSVWDLLQAISRCGRGSPTWAPGKLGVVWDADNQPVVASFNMANIKRGTFEVAYQSEAPVEEVILTYVDAAADYAPDQVRALAPGVTSPTKSATIELWGCTSQAQAVKECHLALAENIYRTRMVSWETDMEGLVVTRGDVVSLSHDLTQWGKSGRLVSGTTTELVLDQAITLESTGTWIGIISPDGTQYTCRVAYQAGEHSAITLLDPLPVAPDADNPIDWRYTADYVATPGKLVKIVSLVPSGMHSVRISAVDEYDEYYAAENGTYTPPTKRPWASNQPQIRSLGVTEEIVKSGGSHTTKLIISWTEAGNVASRLVRYSLDGGPLEIAGYANGSRYELIVPDAGTVMIVVTLYDGLGQTSSGAQASVTHTLQGLAYAPFELASFTGVGGLFQNRLSWTFQGDINDVKFVEVWGGNLNNRANATLLTTQAVPANGWLHTGLQTGQTWFYWARVVDSKNRPSDYLPLSATAGLAVTTSSDPSDLLDALTGAITEDALYIDLASRIDLIDAPTTGALAQISAVQSQVNSLQAEVADLSGTEAYDPAVTYQAEDIVTYNGGLYRALQTTTGNLPTNTTYWAKIGDYASLGEAVSGLSVAVDDLDTRVTATEGGLSSEVTARSTLATQLRGSYTGTDVAALTSGLIYSERQARSTADASEVTARQALATKMTGAADPSSLTLATLSSGLLYDERQARSTADATEVTARQALSAKLTGFSDPNGKVLADLTSGLIFEEKTARVDAVSAVASDVSTLSTTVAGHTTSIQTHATSINGIEAKYTVKIDNNGYVTGYGLISTANNGTPTSAFTILADKFQIVTPGKTAKVPFVVGTVNGASAVGIDGTLVVDGSIVAQKIDTRGLTIKDASGNVILSSGVPLDWARVGGTNRPEDNATVGAPAGTFVGGVSAAALADQSINKGGFYDAFESGNADQWDAISGAGEISIATATDSLTGGKVLRVGNNSGNDERWLIHRQNVPFDPSALYRIKVRARRLLGTGTFFCGLAGVAADGATWANIAGGNYTTNQHYVAAAGKSPSSDWTEYVGYVKGTAASGNGATVNAVDDPATLHSDVRYVRPMLILNYNDAAGQMEVDFVSIENLTEAMAWNNVTGSGKPEDGATVGAPAGTMVNGVPVATITTAVANFNASNDRNATAITAPTIATTGTAIDHTIQTDGSADISFEWSWSGTEGDIDGFLVFVRQSTSSSAYTFGTTPAEETVYTVPASKRAFILFGTAANKYYTLGVQAYRSVDKDISSAGVIKSTLVKATGSGENPYRPSSTVAFAGNVTGTLDGIATADLNKWDKISGAGKPEDGATVGATWGSNISGQPTSLAGLNAAEGAQLSGLAQQRLNLLSNSGFMGSAQYPNGWAEYNNGAVAKTAWVGQREGLFNSNVMYFRPDAPTTQALGIYTNISTGGGVRSAPNTGWLAGWGYRISFYAMAISSQPGAAGKQMHGLYSNMNFTNTEETANPPLVNDVWQRYEFYGVANNNGFTATGELYISWKTSGTLPAGALIAVCCPQVEIGAARATRWGIAPTDLVGLGNPITAGNASTYIANAAIGKLQVDLASANRLIVGNANIDDAAITTAKIGTAQVDTLRIGVNAVTVPQHVQAVAAENQAVWCPGNTESRIISISDYIDAGGNPAIASFSGQLTYSFAASAINYVGVAVIVNGTVYEWRSYEAGSSAGLAGTISFTTKLNLPAGSCLIQVGLVIYPWSGGTTVQYQATPRRTLSLLGCKR